MRYLSWARPNLTERFAILQGGKPDVSISILGASEIRIGREQTYYAVIQNHGLIDAPLVAAVVSQSRGAQSAISVGGNSSAQAAQTPQPLIRRVFFGPVPPGIPIALSYQEVGQPSCPVETGQVRTAHPFDSCAMLQILKEIADSYLNSLYTARFTNLLLILNEILPTSSGVRFCFDPSNPASAAFCDALLTADANYDLQINLALAAQKALCAAAQISRCPLNCGVQPSALINIAKIGNDGLAKTVKQLKKIFALQEIPLDQLKVLDADVALLQTQALALPSSLTFPPFPNPPPPITDLSADDSSSLQICGVESLDPNGKSGARGVGSLQYLQGNGPTPYFVSFENSPSAKAAAAVVNISDQLDSSLDLSTLAFRNIQIGSNVLPLPGTPNFAARLDLRPTQNFLVNVQGSLSNNLLSIVMTTIDPETGKPPTNTTLGFLPPDKNPPEGEGSISHTVMPKVGLTTGTQIQNQASIIFDENEPIVTPKWLNTVDNTPPTSHVLPLPLAENNVSFPLTWSGTDVGAGVQDFTIFSSDNGGAFSAWLQNVTATSATFTGQLGHTYAFYSTARDPVGNVEPGKTTAEATTRVEIDTTPPVITPNISGTLGANGWYTSGVTVTWSVTDPESGISSSTGCSPTTLKNDTAGTVLTCSAKNGAGLSNSVSVTIKIDQTPPSISGLPGPGCVLWPPNHKLVHVATVTASDAGSGMASFSVTGNSNDPDCDIKRDIVITGSGLQPRTVQLRAERSGKGNGRVYTLTAAATDQAGNHATATATCTVPHNQ